MHNPEPELITVVEGPTPEFRPSPQLWFQSVYEGPTDAEIVVCELRTLNGQAILERCLAAWEENRPVKLDFPDYMRMRQQLDVVAMRLRELDEGTVLVLWIRQPADAYTEEEEGSEDSEDDYFF